MIVMRVRNEPHAFESCLRLLCAVFGLGGGAENVTRRGVKRFHGSSLPEF